MINGTEVYEEHAMQAHERQGRDQWAVTILIGYPKPNLHTIKFAQDLIKAITHMTGGCYIPHGHGYWREDGAECTDEFSGELCREETLCIETTVELHKWDKFYSTLKVDTEHLKAVHGVKTQWVHVTKQAIVGHHFEV